MISPHNMRHTNVSFRGNAVTVGIQPSGVVRSARLPRRYVVAPRNDIVWAVATTAMPFEQLSFRGNGVTVGIQPSGAPTKQALAQNCGASFCPSHIESEEGLRG